MNIPPMTSIGPTQIELGRGRLRRRLVRMVFTHGDGLRLVGSVTRRQRTLCARSGHRDGPFDGACAQVIVKHGEGPWIQHRVRQCPRCLALRSVTAEALSGSE